MSKKHFPPIFQVDWRCMRFLAQRATSVPTSRHTRCVLRAQRCRREDGRATHPHHRGGWRGGIACRNPVVKSTHTRGKNALRRKLCGARSFTKDYHRAALRRLRQHFFFLEKKNAPDKLRFQKEIRLEMNTNDAKEYLARREIPQLFEVRAGVRWVVGLCADCVIITRTVMFVCDALQKRHQESRQRSPLDV